MFRLFLALLCTTFTAFGAKPWPGVEYVEARAYYYNAKSKDAFDGTPLVKDGKLHPKIENQGGTLVPPEQLKVLLDLLNTKRFESWRPACYWPHHGVVFFGGNKKIVAHYEVCFMCMLQNSEPKGVAHLTDLAVVADFFEKLKLPIGPEANSAKDFRKEWEFMLKASSLRPLKE